MAYEAAARADAAARRSETINIAGARANNLRDVSLRIPKHRITVFTGVSGSGKSSVVFDTVAVESQRQLNETFTWFIRNRLPKHEQPDADAIENISAAIVVDQKRIGGNARSTVGTMTDIYSLVRLLFSRIAAPRAGAESSAYSFNDPQGMCPECEGLGWAARVDINKLLDTSKSLNGGAIRFPTMGVGTWQWQVYGATGLFDADKPLRDYTDAQWHKLLYGSGFKFELKAASSGNVYKHPYEGLADRFTRLYLKRDVSALSEKHRAAVLDMLSEVRCPACDGKRLNPAALASRINGRGIADYAGMEVSDLAKVAAEIDDPVAAPIVAALTTALDRITGIGLGYLSLDRATATLSGGETQRLKTVRHLGSSLTDMTYIFDEPSVGLHPRDVGRLNDLLIQLRDKGNTVLVVEHDRDVIAIADHVIDMGPGAGAEGGDVVFAGTVAELAQADTRTGGGLRNTSRMKGVFREPTGWLAVHNAGKHNLKDVSVRIPTGVLTSVTGVAGSGKSTLISDVFTAAYPETLVVDQSAVGASARSTPATYLGLMDGIRRMFAKASGADAGLFSFNSSGACPTCQGRGIIYTDLAFMDPVTTTCEACAGRRFKDDVLRHTVDGRSIADVLDLTAQQAGAFFTEAGLRRRLQSLADVGLGYLTLGQAVSSLSGGERQRIKLADELHRSTSVYVLDEPTTGLHMADVSTLLSLLDRLVDEGNTVLVIEHNLDVVKHSDWVVDLGPDGGKHGGHVVFEGTPAELARAGNSLTGDYLRREEGRGRGPR